METLKPFLTWSLLSLALAACGVDQKLILREGRVQEGVEVPKENPKKPEPEKIFLKGSITMIDNSTVDLTQAQDKPLVLMFAGFLCKTCAEEVTEIRAALNDPNNAPAGVRLISVVVGENQQVAQLWKQIRSVPWEVGFEPNIELFTEYCGAQATPCTLIQTPQDGLVYKHIGKTPIETIQEFTGPWEADS